MRVVTNLDIVVQHALLPAYGMKWHKEPMTDIWDNWLAPYYDRRRAAPPP